MTPPDLYDLVFGSKDYLGEARKIHAIVQERAPGARSLLDVACGTGRHLEHLAEWYEVEGLDIDPAMLERARTRLLGVPLHQGDMRAFDLGREFDAVTCLFSAIASVVTVEGLRRAIAAMARHLRRGGVLVVEPWDPPDTERTAGAWVEAVEEPGRKVALIETSTLQGRVWVEEAQYLVWTPSGIEHRLERGATGAFTRDEQLTAFRDVGLGVEHDPVGLMNRGLFIGVRR